MNYWERLKNFWAPSWWSLGWIGLGLPALYFWQTLVHEGMHGFTALFATGEFPKVAPFPHVSAVAGFRNGVTFTGGEGFIAMPQFVDMGLIILLAALCIWLPTRSHQIRFMLSYLFLGVCVDLLYNTFAGIWAGSGEFSDWGKFQVMIGDAGIIILSIFILLLAFSHFLWVYFSVWHSDPLPAATGWDFRWVALVFQIASLCAILFAAIVEDPSIDKSHGVFIFYLVLQIVAVIGYSVYFGLTFRFGR